MKTKMTQKKAINLIFSLGRDLINDLAKEDLQKMTLEEYGSLVLSRHKDLYEFKNIKKKEG